MNTRQLEEKSELERHAVEDTIGELHRRLSPGQLVDELLAYTKDGGGEFISNLGRQATNNPLPVTLIGAGLAWFLFSKGGGNPTGQRVSRIPTPAMGSETDSGYPGSESGAAAKEASNSALGAMRHGASSVSDGIYEGVDSAKANLSSATHSVTDSIARGASAVSDTAHAATLNASALASNALGFLKDQPFVLLGAGLALGAALGAGLPTTEAENDLMGEASDGVKKQAKEAASSQLDKAKTVGADIYEDIKQEVRDGISGLAEAQNGHATAGNARTVS